MAFFSWWYGEGWGRQMARSSDRMVGLLDMFSFDLLLRTLFQPFRQISSGAVQGSLSVQMQAIVDKLISRFIGAMIRIVMLFVGLLSMIVVGVFSLAQVLIWPLLPAAPLIGLLLMTSGWLPWR
ncbi:MAG: hypothetical protein WBB39_03340 [Candidatus Saccharimonadales bacterium]